MMEDSSDSSPLGHFGVLLIATRGKAGPGEALIKIRGGSETYLAYSEEPLPKGTPVLVVESRGTRTVEVTPWTDPFPVI
jgi:membrane protein implicated in regulation of membrane protease activity